MRPRILPAVAICLALGAGSALASWYDDYDAGIVAARKGQWSTVVSKMSAAIKGNAKESDKARTYGAVFINYHPFYYRGVGNLNLGNYQAAIDDFEKTSGPGELDLGSLETLINRAKSRLEADSTPAPVTPTPTPSRPDPVPTRPDPTPATPTVDPATRTRAETSLANARARIQAAQQRRATAAPEYAQALRAFTDANTRHGNARTTDDYRAVASLADNAAFLADSAQAPTPTPVTPTPTPSRPDPVVPTPIPSPGGADDTVLSDSRERLRSALESYYRGDFDDAARMFKDLSRDLPNNGWIWAFLGAAQYSQYAFEPDEQYLNSAMESFRKAKRLRSWKNGLPEKYFSKRIRRVFASAS